MCVHYVSTLENYVFVLFIDTSLYLFLPLFEYQLLFDNLL